MSGYTPKKFKWVLNFIRGFVIWFAFLVVMMLINDFRSISLDALIPVFFISIAGAIIGLAMLYKIHLVAGKKRRERYDELVKEYEERSKAKEEGKAIDIEPETN